jgi:hypothetical protein
VQLGVGDRAELVVQADAVGVLRGVDRDGAGHALAPGAQRADRLEERQRRDRADDARASENAQRTW